MQCFWTSLQKEPRDIGTITCAHIMCYRCPVLLVMCTGLSMAYINSKITFKCLKIIFIYLIFIFLKISLAKFASSVDNRRPLFLISLIVSAMLFRSFSIDMFWESLTNYTSDLCSTVFQMAGPSLVQGNVEKAYRTGSGYDQFWRIVEIYFK